MGQTSETRGAATHRQTATHGHAEPLRDEGLYAVVDSIAEHVLKSGNYGGNPGTGGNARMWEGGIQKSEGDLSKWRSSRKATAPDPPGKFEDPQIAWRNSSRDFFTFKPSNIYTPCLDRGKSGKSRDQNRGERNVLTSESGRCEGWMARRRSFVESGNGKRSAYGVFAKRFRPLAFSCQLFTFSAFSVYPSGHRSRPASAACRSGLC